MDDRQRQFMRFFPPMQEIPSIEPEELGPFILRQLKRDGSLHNRFNFFTCVPNEVASYLMEGWVWLEREGFIAVRPNDQFGLQYFVTRKGDRVADTEDFEAYKKAAMFSAYLDAALIRMVKPLFVRGDYDTAVFRAFKEVEVRVRKKAKYGNDKYGRDLMVQAFGPTGPLTDKSAPKGDQDAMRELFAGAISQCKNPSSHREVQFEDPAEAIDLICFANQLLRIVERLP
jgi:uncharacterized protein (TIGR02391 family)